MIKISHVFQFCCICTARLLLLLLLLLVEVVVVDHPFPILRVVKKENSVEYKIANC